MKKIIYSLLFIMISSNIMFAQEKIEEKDEKKEKTNKNLPIKPDRFYDLNTDTGTWMSLDVSPDGQKIVFDLLGDLYMIPISGGKATRITKGMAFDTNPRFSPDGKKIIMSFAQDGNSDIYTMDLENRIVERITNHPSIDTSPSYSPDGKYITFNSDRSGYQQIYIMKSDGSNVKRISFGNGIYGTPVWSPRGDLIAFTKLHKGNFYIGVMRTDGSGERLLTENYYQEAPSWSPNGRVLIFYRETKTNAKGEGFSAKLWSIDLTGYNERLVTTPTDASDPSWSSLLSN